MNSKSSIVGLEGEKEKTEVIDSRFVSNGEKRGVLIC